MTTQNNPAAVAYSYIRFSHPDQAKGDSLRRQTEATALWCEKNGVTLDTVMTFRDLGKSAFTGEHRKNPDRNALAAFLKLVERGRVPHGSYLLIENLDRLSREDEVPACHLLTGILMAGVRVVQLAPYEMMLTEKSNGWEMMRAVMELSRGHGESAIKSHRIGKAWSDKRKRARENGDVLTRRLPGWIEEDGGKLRLLPRLAKAVRRVFHLAAAGYGCTLIVRKLNDEGVVAVGHSGRWTRSYVGLLLGDRRVLGEFQPRLQDGTPDGDPIADYYPAAISEREWLAARAGAVARRDRPGGSWQRKDGGGDQHLNLFSGLLVNARDGGPYIAITRIDSPTNARKRRDGKKGPDRRVLIASSSLEGKTPCWSFPLPAFETAVLSQLREIDPREILNGDQAPDETIALAGELAVTEARIAELEAELKQGDVAALARALRKLEEEQGGLAQKLAEARQRAAYPLSESWGECQSLAEALASAPDRDDARLRLRSALRRITESICLLVVARGRDRLAAVQVWFAGGKKSRGYFIRHRPVRSNALVRKDDELLVGSLAKVMKPGGLDLRNPTDAAALAAQLEAIDLKELSGW